MGKTSINHAVKEEDAVAGRYTLYLNNGCPFAHRASIAHGLKDLKDSIDIVYSHFAYNKDALWEFNGRDNTDLDINNGYNTIKELYLHSDPDYEARYTIPVLWDKKLKKIVSNESADVVTIFNTQFNNLAKNPSLNLRPDNLASQIDEFVDYYSKNLFFKVYQAGNPEKYSEVFDTVFETIDKLEKLLQGKKYLFGDEITEADIKLFVVLIRFDCAISPIFKLNFKLLKEYPNILNYMKLLYQNPAIKPTVQFDHIKGMYYSSPHFNAGAIVPKGPSMDYLNDPIIN